jgi:hypothetical protein
MRTSVRRTLCATAIAGGFTVLGFAFATSSASAADTPPTTSGQSGLVSGNQTEAQAHAPVSGSGNQVTVIGDRNEADSSPQVESSPPAETAGQSTTGEDRVGSGNQTDAGATAPVQASDNQVTVIGDGNRNQAAPDSAAAASTTSSGSETTSGENGAGSGNQTDAGATAPVQASDNQVTVIGDGNRNQAAPNSAAPASTTSSGSETTSGENGAGSGNQTDAGATAPVQASDNQVTVIGDGNTAYSGTTGEATTGSSGGGTTSGKNGAGSGNQIKPSFRAPVSASDNQVTVIGDGNTTESNNPDEGDTESPVDGSDEESSEVSTPTGDTPADHSTGAGSQAAAAGQIAHAAPAAAVAIAGTLPQTGASTGLLLWTLLGLAALMLGLGLVTGGRDRFAGHLRGQGAAREL